MSSTLNFQLGTSEIKTATQTEMSKSTAKFSSSQPVSKDDDAMVNEAQIRARFAKYRANRLEKETDITTTHNRLPWQVKLEQNHGFYFEEPENAITTSSIMPTDIVKIWHPVLSLPKRRDMLQYEDSMLYQPYTIKQVSKSIADADDKVKAVAKDSNDNGCNQNAAKHKKFDDIIVDDQVCVGVELVGRVVILKSTRNEAGYPEGHHYSFVLADASGQIVAQYWSNTGYDDKHNAHVEEMCDVQDLQFIIEQETREDNEMKLKDNEMKLSSASNYKEPEASLEAQADDTDMLTTKQKRKTKTKNIKNMKNVSADEINYGDIIKIFGRIAIVPVKTEQITFILVYKFNKITPYAMAHHYVNSYKVMLERLGGDAMSKIVFNISKKKYDLEIVNERIKLLQRKIQNYQSTNDAAEEAKFQEKKNEVNKLMEQKISMLTFIHKYTLNEEKKGSYTESDTASNNGIGSHGNEEENILTSIKTWIGDSACLDALQQ